MNDAHETAIVTGDREQLAYLLTEAAEIEHGLMCCYLFAAFSLKRGTIDGLGEDEARAVAGWRRTILDVAIDEMLHLALVNNILTAIGVSPHFERQNFPVAPGYHPAGVVVALAPFERTTLDHFVFLERPEGTEVPDGGGFEPPATYIRGLTQGGLVPSAQDYRTVGHLYRGIRMGIEHLAELRGEKTLFLGNPRAQVDTDIAPLDGLIPVTDVKSAIAAVDLIVEQGEGAPDHHERSHYSRFVAIREEYAAILKRNPDFLPAFPVARNPVMRRPPDPRGKTHIEHPDAARILDLANAVYGLALRCLARAFGQAEDSPLARKTLVSASIDCMRLVTLVSGVLVRMPARIGESGTNAGLTFTMQRSGVGFTQGAAAFCILVERAREIAAQAQALAPLDDGLPAVGKSLLELARRLESVAR